MGQTFQWTATAEQTLRQMAADKFPASQIAEALGGGLTKSAIIGKASRLKVDLSANRVIPTKEKQERAKLPSAVPPRLSYAVSDAALAALFELPAPAVSDRPVTLADLSPFGCRWIESPIDGLNTLYCGNVRGPGSSYCHSHAELASGGKPQRRAAYSAMIGAST